MFVCADVVLADAPIATRRYRLNRLVKRPRGTVVRLPPIEDRLTTVQSYRRILHGMLRQLSIVVNEDIIPRYAQELAQKRNTRRLAQDAVGRDWFYRLRQLGNTLSGQADAMVERVLELEGQRHTETFATSVKSVLGIDLTAVVRNEDIADYLETAAARNAALIQDLSDGTVKNVARLVTDNVAAGNSVKTLRSALTDTFKFSQSRADLIATDQVGKFNSDLNRFRHEQAGVVDYEWMTSHDERVRARHRQLDGRVYKYGQPTGAEDGLPPGQPIRCRCIARGLVVWGPEPTREPSVPEAQPVEGIDAYKSVMRSQIAANVSNEAKLGVAAYRRDSSTINRVLRGGQASKDELSKVMREVNRLEQAFVPTPHKVNVFRGIRGGSGLPRTRDAAEKLIGTEYSDLGYLSTAFDSTARWAGDDGVMMKVGVPKGTPAIMPDAYLAKAVARLDKRDTFGGENELVLPRGTRLKITGIETIKTLKGEDLIQYLTELIE